MEENGDTSLFFGGLKRRDLLIAKSRGLPLLRRGDEELDGFGLDCDRAREDVRRAASG